MGGEAQGKLTETSDEEGYEVPCSLSDQLETVEEGCDGEEGDEDDCSNFVGVVVVKIVLLSCYFAHLELSSNEIRCKTRKIWFESVSAK